jgi:hypothetical protein
MEPILHKVYFICGNIRISIKGEAFGTVAKKDVGQFPLYLLSHKLNIMGFFFRNCKFIFPLTRPRYPLHLFILFCPELQNNLIFCSIIECNLILSFNLPSKYIPWGFLTNSTFPCILALCINYSSDFNLIFLTILVSDQTLPQNASRDFSPHYVTLNQPAQPVATRYGLDVPGIEFG